ncbi:alkaline phosphatase [Gloeocapsopsis dulcis]|uniref:Alkaline phosphatase n=1 Tax=Gloeocapsopsis dulcis AAB1 = 1H9 TaxID=1433147 RepID=A0A6N8FT32_9CHRO|nr:alkaline phosphatase [Gloeocapsopsis dulcis]MUL35485.1 alkaline phosphatase [Gloeocapsopsis dulcis AAB1 = 1H9]WNN90321.1 alkaline phosphatase [Gloeocapsopsis dulcis]
MSSLCSIQFVGKGWKVVSFFVVIAITWLATVLPVQAQGADEELVRIWPTNNTTLLVEQRFDLRVESLIPGQSAPTLESITINGNNFTGTFRQRINEQLQLPGGSIEVGQPPEGSNLFGQTLRNWSLSQPGRYEVVATLNIDGRQVSARNTYRVQPFQRRGNLNKIIFFVGDGMGTPLRTGARIMKYGVRDGQPGGYLEIEKMPVLGLVNTHSLDSIIPDSANTAAAWVSGAKTINNALNAFPDNTPETNFDNPRIETLPQYMKRRYNWGIGMVTTAFLTDATPASFAANQVQRGEFEWIAQQYFDFFRDGWYVPETGYRSLKELSQPVDVLLGPGARHFVPDENRAAEFRDTVFRRDNQDLIAVARQQGYTIVTDVNSMNQAPNDRPLLGLFLGDFRESAALGPQNIPSVLDLLIARGRATIDGRGANQLTPPVPSEFATIPKLEEMTRKAIAALEAQSPQGWMLQVESSQVDKLAHPLDPDRTLYEVLTLDKAVEVTRQFVAENPNSLMLVTADHAQGQTVGGTVDSQAIRENRIDLNEAMQSFGNAGFTTYQDTDNDGYPNEANPSTKLAIGISARPTFRTDFLTDDVNLPPSGEDGTEPNPERDPNGLLLTNDLQRQTTVANHTADDVPIAAQGPGAGLFNGVMDNIEVFQRMAAVISGVRNRQDLATGRPFTATETES